MLLCVLALNFFTYKLVQNLELSRRSVPASFRVSRICWEIWHFHDLCDCVRTRPRKFWGVLKPQAQGSFSRGDLDFSHLFVISSYWYSSVWPESQHCHWKLDGTRQETFHCESRWQKRKALRSLSFDLPQAWLLKIRETCHSEDTHKQASVTQGVHGNPFMLERVECHIAAYLGEFLARAMSPKYAWIYRE